MLTFGCGTKYDWYILKNSANNSKGTLILDEKGHSLNMCLQKMKFIPNIHCNIER
jgi:hypothetical protein